MTSIRTQTLCAAVAFAASFLCAASSARATDYYFDSTDGNDSNTGHAEGQAWQNTAKLEDVTLGPGDHVYFRRGRTFEVTNRFAIEDWDPGIWLQEESSGTSTNPITITAYGDGAMPILRNPTDNIGMNVLTLLGSYINVDGLMFSNNRDGAIIIDDTASHILVTNCEFNQVGTGLTVYGTYITITQNYFHDGIIIRNTMGGDDDYGANGVVVSGSHIDISYNRADRLETPCYDFGFDGGFVELYNEISDVAIHHNVVNQSNGFVEGGSSSNQMIQRVTVAYNVSFSNGGFISFHNGGSDHFSAQWSDVDISNNTVVEDENATVFWFSTNGSAEMFTVRNNIISTPGGSVFMRPGTLVHSHNIFPTAGSVGVTLSSDESSANPMFVNAAANDYHLNAGSPAIDHGTTPSYASDLDGVLVPFGSAADIGAYEYVAPGEDGGMAPDGGLPPTRDAGPPGSDMGMTMSDAGPPRDGGSIPADMGTPPRDDAGNLVDLGTPSADGGVTPMDGGGSNSGLVSGCSVTHGQAQSATLTWFTIMALVSLLALRRRRA